MPGAGGDPSTRRPTATRRQVLGAMAATGAAVAAGCGTSSPPRRLPAPIAVGSAPNPAAPLGSDQFPAVSHIVVVMLENHSFDNLLGMAGRGDGFTLDAHGRPTASNPDGSGRTLHAFHMPTPCQLHGHPSNDWTASHVAYDGGTMQGFVKSASGPVAMGYWTPADMPYTNALATTFPMADRWFSSTLCQTYPNRRYLLAGTSYGLVTDTFPPAMPPNGTILDSMNAHGVSWRDYYTSLPTAYVFPKLIGKPGIAENLAGIDAFFRDCAAGSLPAVSFVEPDYGTSSEEDPQDIQLGEAFLASVVNAVMAGPKWSETLLVWTYDEGGGYYDHVPPPAAVAPDDVAPDLSPGDPPGRFDRYGFRVPAGVVSPYARSDHVSHTVYDHTSILKLIETKWNLPTLTRRDAAAASPLDMIDVTRPPAFLTPPRMPTPAGAASSTCLATGPGVVPPASAYQAG